MTMMNKQSLEEAILHICDQLVEAMDELNKLDSQLGDGDLGTTLNAIAKALQPKLTGFSDDIGTYFGSIAEVISKISGSSFSAVTMFGLLKISSLTKNRREINWAELPQLLDAAIAAMSARGGAKLGDKTVLDGLAAISEILKQNPTSQDISSLARVALEQALDEFKHKPSKIGRARLAGARNQEQNDPGMYALYLAVKACSAKAVA